MRGFTVIDNRSDDDQIAVWVVSRVSPTAAGNSNAVSMVRSHDAAVQRAVRSLTRNQAILVTEGSTLDGLPVDSKALTVADVRDLIDETSAIREQILSLVQYLRRKPPIFVSIPDAERFHPTEHTAQQRAPQAANLLGRVWTAWLDTDLRRRAYSADPRAADFGRLSGGLSSLDPMLFPPSFGSRIHAEPLV
jgi:hypothetical protein